MIESIDSTRSSLETLRADLTNSISTSKGEVATAITTGDGKIEAALNGNRDQTCARYYVTKIFRS